MNPLSNERDLEIVAWHRKLEEFLEQNPPPERDFKILDAEQTFHIALIEWANRGNVNRAAKRLGLNRTTLVERMRKFSMRANPAFDKWENPTGSLGGLKDGNQGDQSLGAGETSERV